MNAMDQRITFPMFLQGMQSRFQGILAKTLFPEEKLRLIIQEMEKEVQSKRVLAREIGAQMRALKDPETKTLEPLEALEVRRAKLVVLGAQKLDDPAALGQFQQEIGGLDKLIASQSSTYGTLKESYDLAVANYKTAFNALETTRTNGPAILSALKAHEQALAMKDKAKTSSKVIDMKFMDDLTGELEKTKAELRTDAALDRDLDATKDGSIDAKLAKMDAATVDENLMAEFRAAAEKKAAK